jgi:hypothetical protein
MAKKNIRMAPAEVEAFLAARSGELVTVVAGPEGQAPFGDLARLEFNDGLAGFRLDAGARVIGELASDGRVCCIVDQRPFEATETSYFNTRSAMLHGTARRVEGASAGEVRFALVIEKVVSFDFSKLRSDPAAMVQ